MVGSFHTFFIDTLRHGSLGTKLRTGHETPPHARFGPSGRRADGRKPGRLRKVALIVLPGIAVVAAAGLAGGGWYFSGQVIDVTHEPPDYPLAVQEVDDRAVTLPLTEETARDGAWGLAWDGGSVRLGPIIEHTSDHVVRHYDGPQAAQLEAGLPVRVDTWGYDGDPKSAHGIDYSTVQVDSPVGKLPAWFVPGEGSTWVIGVHGRNASPGETLRILPELDRLGVPVLAMNYRNDRDAPPAPDGEHHLGDAEWEDVAAAVDYARAEGAESVVLYGWSMGGSIVMATLRRMDDPGFVSGVILDSPVLDWSSTLDKQGAQRGLPQLLTSIAKRTVEFRTGIRLADLDHRAFAPELERPILLFADLADETVDVDATLEFAADGGDLVTLVETRAGHTASWNENPGAYEAAVAALLAEHA